MYIRSQIWTAVTRHRFTPWRLVATYPADMKAVPGHRTPYLAGKQGSALIVALWVIIMLSMLVGSLAFNMQMEARLTSRHRKLLKAEQLARAGTEWAKFLLIKSGSSFSDEDTYGEEFRIQLINLKRGLPLNGVAPPPELGEWPGEISVSLVPEQGRRNVNNLRRVDWEEMFDRSLVPEEYWDELIDSFDDWTDDNDLHKLNGAESDDAFYEDAGYEVKNAPVDTIDELLLIKGFSESLLYGGPSPEDEEIIYSGIAHLLTTFGDGKVNINTASRDILMTFPEIDEIAVEDILEGRLGADGEANTEDDGFTTLQQALGSSGVPAGLASLFSVDERRYVRVISIGDVEGVRRGIWAIYFVSNKDVVPVFWREEDLP